ncbi:MAG: gliding motility protein [Myxococcales bacterium]|nr:gliding motility protein [Myxococcales bacterium]
MHFDFNARELTIKLVYYGPALSGKTSNLQAIHRLVDPSSRGRLMTLETKDDRTLFFDLLPLTVDAGSMRLRIKLFTVPGQVMHDATRRLVLQGADGIAFIADSQINETKANQIAFRNMLENLEDNDIDPDTVPIVIQFNKRDLREIRTHEELQALAKQSREPIFEAVAIHGTGVVETFLGLMELSWSDLERRFGLTEKVGIEPEVFFRQLREQLGMPEGGR